MAIVFTCACGRKLQVAEKLAGKKGKCPQCGAVLMIPLESEPVIEEPTPEPEPQVSEGPTEPCPHCAEPIAVGAVFCTKCGTDLRTGQKHQADESDSSSYDMLKLWPDIFAKPAHAVGVIVESPLNADNFVKALGLLLVGLVGFMLLWVLYATPQNIIDLAPKATRWYYFPGFFIVGFILLVIDTAMTSLAGKQFGSTGTSLAQTVMSLIMTNAVAGFVHLLVALVVIFGKNFVPYEPLAQFGPWVLMAWSAWLTTSVIYRAYDTSQAMAVLFGIGAAGLKGAVAITALKLMTLGS